MLLAALCSATRGLALAAAILAAAVTLLAAVAAALLAASASKLHTELAAALDGAAIALAPVAVRLVLQLGGIMCTVHTLASLQRPHDR